MRGFFSGEGGEGVAQDGFEQAVAFSSGDSELRFQPVAQHHQLVHLGDNAVLLGEYLIPDRAVPVNATSASRSCSRMRSDSRTRDTQRR
jgi:hypothetical protein